ncbi:MAG: hypothetical protein IT370_01085 [Deltaproteobacteria bacterium]|nr:hypothetical protein [Deltaproteobacteria bacterium]
MLLLTLGLLGSCSRQPREPRMTPRPALAAPADAGAAVAVTPGFTPGRFACDVRKQVFGTHQLNVYSETTRASLLLELAPGGTVTGVRGVSSRSDHDGPEVHERRQLTEQQGYRGSWTAHDGLIVLQLTPDDGVIPPIRAYSNMAPGPWRLLCTPLQHATGAALLCNVATHGTYDESYGLEVPHLAPGDDQRHILLGAGPGVAVSWKASVLVGDPDRDAEVSVTSPAAPIIPETWSQP